MAKKKSSVASRESPEVALRNVIRDIALCESVAEEKEALDTPKHLWAPRAKNKPQTMGYDSPAEILGFGGAAGGGKQLDLKTPVPIPTGWTTVGQLREGDQLFTEHGKMCKITTLYRIDPEPESYRITFDDGSTIDACADHQWLTFDYNERVTFTRRTEEGRAKQRAHKVSKVSGNRSAAFTTSLIARNKSRVYQLKSPSKGTVRSTLEIANSLVTDDQKQANNHAVPVLSQPLNLPEANLPLDPYLFGVWLGDGHTNYGAITTIDPEIVQAWRDGGFDLHDRSHYGPHACSYGVYKLKALLRKMKVLGNKHVPTAYLRASAVQRLALLQGLMDTDGYAKGMSIGKEVGTVEFTSTKRCLAEAVAELADSLGFKSNGIRAGVATLNGRVISLKYCVRFSASMPVFRLPRKVRWQKMEGLRQTVRFRYIVSCERITPRPMRCLAVDNPTGLFLVGKSMIPTHNSDLLLGLAITRHKRSLILRREGKQLRALIDRSREVIKNSGRFNENTGIWRDLPGDRQIELGGVKDAADVFNYRGRPKDFLGIDEADMFTEPQIRFLMGWVRTTDPGQRCRVVLGFNPPVTAEGRWLLSFFGPWLDPKHSNPAKPGELRWFAMLPGAEREVERPDSSSFDYDGETIFPKSRTFIPAHVEDNPDLMRTGYKAQLQALPEPYRSQLLKGDFRAGLQDDEWQVIPTMWVEAAQARWKMNGGKEYLLSGMGVDVALGGEDKTVISKRFGPWFALLKKYPGIRTNDGAKTLALILNELEGRKNIPVNLDIVNIGSATYTAAKMGGYGGLLTPINFSSKCTMRSRDKIIRFANLRAYAYWSLREALDPNSDDKICLPPDPELLTDLSAPRYEVRANGYIVEDKRDIKARIGRSPDCGDAVVLAHLSIKGEKPFVSTVVQSNGNNQQTKLP